MAKKKNQNPSDDFIDSVIEDIKTDLADLNKTKLPPPPEEVQQLSEFIDKDKTTLVGEGKSEPPRPTELSAMVDKKDDKTVVLDEKPKAELPAAPRAPTQQKISEALNISSKALDSNEAGSMLGAKAPPRGTPFDAHLIQAENMKLAQTRILELEKEIEKLRSENEMLTNAGNLAQEKIEDLMQRLQNLERIRLEMKDQNESELRLFRDGIASKDAELNRLLRKVEELETRLSSDLKRVRVRERELENRLELSRVEKNALVRTKDESILELKRKLDSMTSEIENYRQRVLDLNQKLDANHDKLRRTVRALRLALTNLEVDENTSSITLAPIKKAE